MRNLITITLLLFCLTGWGQGTLSGEWDTIHWVEYTPPKDIFIQKSKYIWYNEATRTYIDSLPAYNTMNLVVNLWKEYKQECWNDSTWNQASSWGFDTPEDAEYDLQYWRCFECHSYVMNKLDGKYYLGYWIHKEPTLEGFMEYVERKMK